MVLVIERIISSWSYSCKNKHSV